MTGIILNNISDCYIGSNQVSEIWLGQTKIWPNQSHDYSTDYLTFECVLPGTITWNKTSSAPDRTISYSTDNGSTWTSVTSSENGTLMYYFNNSGDKIIVKGTNTAYGLYTSNTYNYFGGTAAVQVYGNIMSLIYGDNFIGQTTMNSIGYIFYSLFREYDGLIEACNLILPSTTLVEGCYRLMFYRCSNLYNTPTLPAMTLADYCYSRMFAECPRLVTAPELPATTLAIDCYFGMFRDCTSLIAAPELSATILINACYQNMFSGCTSLNYVKCYATDISATDCISSWLNGVSSTGTFYKDSNTTYPTGTSGIPSGWTVVNI